MLRVTRGDDQGREEGPKEHTEAFLSVHSLPLNFLMGGHLWYERDRRLKEGVSLGKVLIKKCNLCAVELQLELAGNVRDGRSGNVAEGKASLGEGGCLLGVPTLHVPISFDSQCTHTHNEFILHHIQIAKDGSAFDIYIQLLLEVFAKINFVNECAQQRGNMLLFSLVRQGIHRIMQRPTQIEHGVNQDSV